MHSFERERLPASETFTHFLAIAGYLLRHQGISVGDRPEAKVLAESVQGESHGAPSRPDITKAAYPGAVALQVRRRLAVIKGAPISTRDTKSSCNLRAPPGIPVPENHAEPTLLLLEACLTFLREENTEHVASPSSAVKCTPTV